MNYKDFVAQYGIELFSSVVILVVVVFRFLLFDLAPDALYVWEPMSASIAGGEAPYTDVPDNKPPLFILLVALGGLIDFRSIMTLAVFLAEIALVFHMSRFIQQETSEFGHVVAVLLLTGGIALIHVNYLLVNNKSIALAVLIFSMRFRTPEKLGGGIALAGLFAQQVVFSVPAIVWYRIRSTFELIRFVLSGVAIVALGYLSVLLIWGVDAMMAAVKQTVLVTSYVTSTGEYSDTLSIWEAPIEWILAMKNLQQPLIVPGIFALLGALLLAESDDRAATFSFLLSISFLLLLPIRPWPHYSFFVILPFSILGGYGVSKAMARFG